MDKITQQIIQFLAEQPHLFTSKQIALSLGLDIDEVGRLLIEGRDKYFVEPTLFHWKAKDTKPSNELGNDSSPAPTKESDKWYTPPRIVEAITQVLGAIALDPCADDGKHIPAATHYTAADDGLSKEWHGKVFMNPPYSCPGKWMTKLQGEIDALRVTEAIALVPAATDTNWLHPYLAHQPICLWKGRIKFLDTNYKQKDAGRQSHCLLYWGDNPQKFKEVFDPFGTVKNVSHQSSVISQESTITPTLSHPMTFQFPQAEAIASQIAQLQNQLKQLSQYQDTANTLLTQVTEHAQAMKEAGLEGQSLYDWADKIYLTITGVSVKDSNLLLAQIFEQGDTSAVELLQKENASLIAKIEELRSDRDNADTKLGEILTSSPDVEQLKQEVEGLKSSNKILRQEREQLQQQLNFARQDTREADSYLSDIERLEKENTDYQQRYDGIKAQKEQWESDYYKIKSDRDRLQKRVELLDRDNHAFLERIQQLESQFSEAQEFKIGDRVTTDMGEEGQVTGFAYGNAIVKVTNGEFQFKPDTLTKVEQSLERAEGGRQKAEGEDGETEKGIQDTGAESNLLSPASELLPSFAVGDIVQREDGKVGTVTYVPSPFKGILSVQMIDGGFNYHATSLKLISRPDKEEGRRKREEGGDSLLLPSSSEPLPSSPEADARLRGQQFIAGITKASDAKAIAWPQIQEVCQGNTAAFREIALGAKTKVQKKLIEDIPVLLAGYIHQTGDRSDLGWVGNTIKSKVEAILQPQEDVA